MTNEEKEMVKELSQVYGISEDVLISHIAALGLPEVEILLEDTYGSGDVDENF